MKHRGKFIQQVIESRGVKITQLAGMIGKNRITLYNWFKEPNLPAKDIKLIGNAIGYDFRSDFPELFPVIKITSEPEGISGLEKKDPEEYWKQKYIHLQALYIEMVSKKNDDLINIVRESESRYLTTMEKLESINPTNKHVRPYRQTKKP